MIDDLDPMDPIDVDRGIAASSLYGFVALSWEQATGHPFVPGMHLRVLCEVLEGVSFGRTKRLGIAMPPSMGKSTVLEVLWPAWHWAIIAGAASWMYVSYDLTRLNRWSEDLVKLLQGEWFIARWGRLLRAGTHAMGRFDNLARGFRFNTSMGGKATGWHTKIQVFDDPIKAKDANGNSAVTIAALLEARDRLTTTFASRHTDPNTFARVLNMQRLHLEDPIAWAIAQGWDVLVLPMRYEADHADPRDWRRVEGELLCEARMSEETALATEAENPDVWETQYQQRPTARGAAIVKEEWISEYRISQDEAASIRDCVSIQSWDLAFKGKKESDFVAGQWWKARYQETVLHVRRVQPDESVKLIALPARNLLHCFMVASPPFNERAGYAQSKEAIREKRLEWKSGKCVIEDKANGPAIEDELRLEFPGWIEMWNPTAAKDVRLQATQEEWSNGLVHVVDGPHMARWRKDFPGFPNIRRDDEIDCATQAILYLRRGGHLIQTARAMWRR